MKQHTAHSQMQKHSNHATSHLHIPNALRRPVRLMLMVTAAATVIACNNNDVDYPNLITEFVEMNADANGQISSITNDDGRTYLLTRTYSGYKANAAYRTVCGYVLGFSGTDTTATVYKTLQVHVLADSTKSAFSKTDALGVQSIWQRGHYVNFILLPQTQGGTHRYAYRIDSLPPHHVYVTLLHDQNSDPTSYTTTHYASLPLRGIASLQSGDTLTVAVNTTGGLRRWMFPIKKQ
jgi:hypothetical protein